ncbi:MAG: hypothetical protein WA324_02280 [Bryobacteraceae bacterium]
MNYIEQEIVLKTDSPYRHGVPLVVSSPLLRRLESTARPSVRMLLEGTSASVGAPPAWLARASDIRTLGFSTKEGCSVLHVKAPTLGEAVPQLFEQQSLWPTPASPDDTALQVMGRIAVAVRRQQLESDLYDRPLLKHYSAWSGLFRQELRSIEFPVANAQLESIGQIDQEVTSNAKTLSDRTPSPRQVRVVGTLDMVRHSTRSFGLVLDSGDEIRGVLIEGTSEMLQGYFGRQITVLGKAIYRPSGTLLRLDASEILPSVEGREAFSKIPPALVRPYKPDRRPQTSKGGVAAFFGSWPGEETDRELLAALEEIRG